MTREIDHRSSSCRRRIDRRLRTRYENKLAAIALFVSIFERASYRISVQLTGRWRNGESYSRGNPEMRGREMVSLINKKKRQFPLVGNRVLIRRMRTLLTLRAFHARRDLFECLSNYDNEKPDRGVSRSDFSVKSRSCGCRGKQDEEKSRTARSKSALYSTRT